MELLGTEEWARVSFETDERLIRFNKKSRENGRLVKQGRKEKVEFSPKKALKRGSNSKLWVMQCKNKEERRKEEIK